MSEMSGLGAALKNSFNPPAAASTSSMRDMLAEHEALQKLLDLGVVTEEAAVGIRKSISAKFTEPAKIALPAPTAKKTRK